MFPRVGEEDRRGIRRVEVLGGWVPKKLALQSLCPGGGEVCSCNPDSSGESESREGLGPRQEFAVPPLAMGAGC